MKKTIIGLSIIVCIAMIFFCGPVITKNAFFPHDTIKLDKNIKCFTKELDLQTQEDMLMCKNRIGVQSVSKRISGHSYMYVLRNYENEAVIIFDSMLDRYFTEENFKISAIDYNNIDCLKISKLMQPEIRKKCFLFSYEYDDSKQMSDEDSVTIISILTNNFDDTESIAIPQEQYGIDNVHIVRLYEKGKQYYYNIGFIVKINNSLYFTEGYLGNDYELTNCYKIK